MIILTIWYIWTENWIEIFVNSQSGHAKKPFADHIWPTENVKFLLIVSKT